METIFGCESCPTILASRWKRSLNAGSLLNCGFMTLSATTRPTLIWIARYTMDIPPWFIFRITLYPGICIAMSSISLVQTIPGLYFLHSLMHQYVIEQCQQRC